MVSLKDTCWRLSPLRKYFLFFFVPFGVRAEPEPAVRGRCLLAGRPLSGAADAPAGCRFLALAWPFPRLGGRFVRPVCPRRCLRADMVSPSPAQSGRCATPAVGAKGRELSYGRKAMADHAAAVVFAQGVYLPRACCPLAQYTTPDGKHYSPRTLHPFSLTLQGATTKQSITAGHGLCNNWMIS